MAQGFWRLFARADAALGYAETAFIGAAIAAASLVLFVNVVLRYVLLAPISWAEEISIYLVIWIVFVGGSVLIRTGGHITVDLLPRALPPRALPGTRGRVSAERARLRSFFRRAGRASGSRRASFASAAG